MIGFIALAGIIVRNSILLVDFAKSKVEEGMSVRDAVVLAAEVRMRPIVITALALVIGSTVLLTDPIFLGMAVSLLFGSIVATFLTLVVIPLGCLSARKSFCSDGKGGECQPPSGPAGGAAPSGRPQRLQKNAAGEPSVAVANPAPVVQSGKPPRLQKKSESVADVPATPTAAPSGGRPPRLEKKSTAAETLVAAREVSVPQEEPKTPSARPARLKKKVEVAPVPEEIPVVAVPVKPEPKKTAEPVTPAPRSRSKSKAVLAPEVPEPQPPQAEKARAVSRETLVERAMGGTAGKAASQNKLAPLAKRKPRGIRIKMEDSGDNEK